MVIACALRGKSPENRSTNEHIWTELYRSLRPSVLSWVYSSGVSSWLGQEQDVAEDILQEAVIRTLKYCRQVENGPAQPIYSMVGFGRTVARNHFRDLRRRELRLVRPQSQPDSGSELTLFDLAGMEIDPAEVVLEALTRLSRLMALARIIRDFPPKQRQALLIDLAKHANFEDERCPFRAAFLATGIDLAVYRSARLVKPLERSRHAASLSMAYKRLRETVRREHRELLI
jgi:DNA-directed RNA polymerase specialized sigma24 family protein